MYALHFGMRPINSLKYVIQKHPVNKSQNHEFLVSYFILESRIQFKLAGHLINAYFSYFWSYPKLCTQLCIISVVLHNGNKNCFSGCRHF